MPCAQSRFSVCRARWSGTRLSLSLGLGSPDWTQPSARHPRVQEQRRATDEVDQMSGLPFMLCCIWSGDVCCRSSGLARSPHPFSKVHAAHVSKLEEAELAFTLDVELTESCVRLRKSSSIGS